MAGGATLLVRAADEILGTHDRIRPTPQAPTPQPRPGPAPAPGPVPGLLPPHDLELAAHPRMERVNHPDHRAGRYIVTIWRT